MSLIEHLSLFDLDFSSAIFLGASTSTKYLDSVNTGQQLASTAADYFWSEIFKSGTFGRITLAMMPVAGFGVLYKGWQILNEYQNGQDWRKIVMGLISIGVVMSLLSQSGANAMYLVLAANNVSSHVAESVLKGKLTDTNQNDLRQSGNNIKATVPFDKFDRALKTCASLGSRDAVSAASCNLNAVTTLKKELTDAGVTDSNMMDSVREMERLATESVNTATGTEPVDNRNLLEKANDTISYVTNPMNIVYDVINTVLTGLTIMFYLAIEVAMLLFGFLLPVNLSLCLFSAEPIKAWIGNFWTLCNAKFCYGIIISIMVSFKMWSQGQANASLAVGVFVIELLMAVAAPFLTFFYCQSSALALAGAVQSVGLSPFKAAGNLGGKAVGAVGGEAGRRISGNLLSRAATHLPNKIGSLIRKAN
jgi:hypothetical protein